MSQVICSFYIKKKMTIFLKIIRYHYQYLLYITSAYYILPVLTIYYQCLKNMTQSTEFVFLEAVDGYSVKINRDYINVSQLLRGLSEDCCIDDAIPMMQVDNKEFMDLLVEYMTYHEGNTDIVALNKPIKDDKSLVDNGACQWDADFIDKLTVTQLAKMTWIAHFLDMTALLQLCCAKFAIAIATTSLNELKTLFNPIMNFH
jgi:hypothetical protein